jgi:hypothetical protein
MSAPVKPGTIVSVTLQVVEQSVHMHSMLGSESKPRTLAQQFHVFVNLLDFLQLWGVTQNGITV